MSEITTYNVIGADDIQVTKTITRVEKKVDLISRLERKILQIDRKLNGHRDSISNLKNLKEETETTLSELI